MLQLHRVKHSAGFLLGTISLGGGCADGEMTQRSSASLDPGLSRPDGCGCGHEGLQPQRIEFFHSEKNLSHLVVDEILPLYLNSPGDSVEESYFKTGLVDLPWSQSTPGNSTIIAKILV